jgi:diadenosine tetraphosphate (Ap4A) HIT family hydrolase
VSTVFSKILAGEIPGRFVWRGDTVSAFLTVAPLRPGHTLVVPHREVDSWTDAPEEFAEASRVAQIIGRAVQRAWGSPRAGLVIAGFEVPHLHLHVFPAWEMTDFDFAGVDSSPREDDLDDAALRVRHTLRGLGHSAEVPEG